MGLTQIPKNLLQGIIKAMGQNYRGRMYKTFIVHMAWLVRGLWKVARQLLDEFTTSKINIYGSDFEADILKVVDEANLEIKYGGKLPNKEGDYFPP